MSEINDFSAMLPGKVGNVRTFIRNGKYYTRSTTIKRKAPLGAPSKKWMRVRLLHTAATDMWKTMKPLCCRLFEKKRPGSTAYTRFLSLNGTIGAFFTREERQHHFRVALPMQVSEGSLPLIEQRREDGMIVTNIRVEELHINSETTVRDFTSAICSKNDFEQGDTINFVGLLQTEEDGIPRISLVNYSVTLDYQDERLISALIPQRYLAVRDGWLATSYDLPAGCFCFLRTREENDALLCSSQTLISNNDEMTGRYLSDAQFNRAAESYGGCAKDSFVTSDNN